MKVLMTLFDDYGLIVTILMGLSLFFGKVWSNRLHEKDKSKNKQEILQLKDKLEKNKTKIEHFHQISQSTYQNLFVKKITVYQDLIDIKNIYIKEFNEDVNLQTIEYEHGSNYDFYYDFFNQIRVIIDKNKFYISNELFNKYNILYDKIKPFIHRLTEFNSFEMEMHSYREDPQQRDDDIQGMHYEMLQESKKELEDLFMQIEVDIKYIRNKIDLS